MKSVLALSILLSFTIISIFGYTSVHIASQHGKVKCITEQMEGAQCPDARNPLSAADFHLGALKSFSLAVILDGSGNFIYGLTIFLSAMLLASVAVVFFCLPQRFDFLRGLLINSSLVYSRVKISHWLALRENSPNFFYGRE